MTTPLLRRLGATVTGIVAAALLMSSVPLGGPSVETVQAAEPGSAADYPVTMYVNLPPNYSEGTSREALEQQAREQFDVMDKYWLDQSAGKIDLRLASLTWASTPVACISGDERVRNLAAARAEVGYEATPRSRFFFLTVDGCGFYGVAGGSSTDKDVYIQQNEIENGVWVHEFGHTFGFGHAGELYCPGDVVDCETIADGGPGSVAPYGDAADTMGSSYSTILKGLSTPYSIAGGFFEADDYADIAGATTQNVTIRSRDVLVAGADDPQLRAVRITDPVSGRVYVLEMSSRDTYNAPIWWGGRPGDIYTENFPGVENNRYQFDFGVRVLRPADTSTYLLKPPANADGIRRDVWDAGTTFVSPSGGITAQVVSTTRTTATFAIVTRADVDAPAAPSNLTSDGTAVVGTAEAGTTVTATGPDGASLGTVVADAVTGEFTIPLDPAQADGVTLSVVSTDAAGNVSPTAQVVVDVAEPAAPAAPEGLVSTGTTVTGTGEPGSVITVTDADGVTIGTATVRDDGTFIADLAPAQVDGTTLNVTASNTAGGSSATVSVTVVTPAVDEPTPPTGLSSNGTTLTGSAQPGRTVEVTTADGTSIGTAQAGTDGAFTLTLTAAQPSGTVLTVVARGDDGRESAPVSVTVVVPAPDAPASPTGLASDGQAVIGQAGAGTTIRVTAPDGTLLGETVTGDDGTFRVLLSSPQALGTALRVVAVDAAGLESAPATIVVTAAVLPVPPTGPNPSDPAPVDPAPAPGPEASSSPVPAAQGAGSDNRPTSGGALAFTGADLGALSLLFLVPTAAGSVLLIGLWLRRRRALSEPTD